MLLLVLAGCLFDRATYERRLNELTDHDGDGFAYEDDCDDQNAELSPDTEELCDGVDQDCDGEIDDGFAGRAETCDGTDEDCNGVIDDEPVDGTTWYGDADGDGHGLASVVTTACLQPTAYAAAGDDCDDANGAKYPGGTEVPYDGIDQDCSGGDLADVDGDGADAEAAGGDDCNDADAEIYPSAAETWEDGFVDNDCVGGNEGVREEYSATWLGQTDTGQFGYRLGALADLDGDGREEFWSSPLFDPRFGTWGGSVYVLHSDAAADLSDAGQVTPDIERTFLGVSGDVGPDVDGNGALDVVFGGDGHDGGRGAAWILDGASLAAAGTVALPGPARAWVFGEEPSSYLAHELAVLPDFSGDGGAILAVTLPYHSGAMGAEQGEFLLFDWAAEGALGPDAASGGAEGYYAGSQFGLGVRAAPDVDGDGLNDYLVQFAAGDLVVVLPGGLAEPSIPGDAITRVTGTGAGESAACDLVGDVDADGEPDMACNAVGGTSLFVNITAQSLLTVDDRSLWIDAGAATMRSAVNLSDRDGDARAETFVTATDGGGGENIGGILSGALADRGGTINLEDLALLAVPDPADARFGYTAAFVAANTEHGAFLLIGGPSDHADGEDRGAVARLSIPE
ncbi:hypothetical protein LBMAG42_20710 [Deltaproteobacteria bacterium]|nr:hypothetical protein LBMAG42_20710 [Deltaproteobacteria bacterium]